MIVRDYQDSDELGWVRCRLLSFLNCSYYDCVERKKEHYKNPSVCAVAEEDGLIAGILDAEYERAPGEVCYLPGEKGAVVWHLGVQPEYQKRGAASQLWAYVKERLAARGIRRVEAWTQDDEAANRWYLRQGFVQKEAYLNAYVKGTPEAPLIQRLLNLREMGEVWGIRCFNFEAPLERKAELEPLCYRLHEVRLYEKSPL